MSFTIAIHQVPFEDSFQGPVEPADITDNSPLSLYILCAKYIVQNISKISINHKLPAEICDNLIELFRIYGSKKICNSFLYALSSKQCSVVSANLSNLDFTDEELIDFVDSQCKTLRSLNISNCNRLSPNVLLQLNMTLLRAYNMSKLYRLVTVYEVPKDYPYQMPRLLVRNNYPYVLKKFYHNGKIRTEVNKNYKTACPESYYQNSFLLRLECPEYQPPTMEDNPFLNMTSENIVFEKTCSKIPKTSYEMDREMGLFCDPYFTQEYIFDLEPSIFASYDRTSDDHQNFDPPMPFPLIKMDQIIKSKYNSLFPEENLDPKKCSYCYGSGLNRQKILILPKNIYHTLHFFRTYNNSKFFGAFEDNYIHTSKFNYHIKNSIDQSDLIENTPDLPGPEDDEDSYIENFPNIRHMPFLFMNEFEYLNTLRRRNFISCDNYLLKTIHTPSEDRLLENNERQKNESYPTQINSSICLLNTQQTPSMSTVTSSSCPLLACSQGFLKLEPSHLVDDSVACIEECNDNTNNYNFPKVLKKFRPHSHNNHSFGDHQNCSQINNQSNSKMENIRPSVNFSSTSLRSFVSSSSNEENRFTSGKEAINFINNTHEITCPLHPQNCPPEYDYFDFLSMVYSADSNEDITSNICLNEERLRFDLFPYKLYRLETPGYPFVRLIEVVTWSPSSLESLSVTECVPSNLEEMQPEIRHSIIFNRDFNKLKRITIQDWPVNMQDMFFLGCKYIERVTYLDLSHCKSIGDGHSLAQMTQLETLILYNVKEVNRAIDSICNLKTLRVLDISNSGDQINNSNRDPFTQLNRLIASLPKLVSLDISGTILAVGIVTSLAERERNPLEFLGIFHTNVEPSSRHFIPALKIAGDNFEDLILNSCEAYMNRPEMLKKCLNELFQIFRYENGQHDLERSVKILVSSLGRHPNDKMIQVAASATLFYIIKSDEAKPLLGRKIKELIVSRLLDAMQTFRYDQTMLRNGCLNLIHFRIPADVISEYTRLADILLYIVTMDDDDFVQRLGIYLLNSLACQVDGEQKTIVGNLGAIEKMLHLIESRYNRNICDEVMETAWSTMWNVTDETPINCERFLNNNGMEFFVSCMEKFPEHPELLRNMMGLLGNVSECAHLRYRLMKEDYINRFVQLLDSHSDGIEVSYNSAGILAHIASDGAEIWNRHLPFCDRDEMLERMKCAIFRWEINSKRNINYRSFEPILRLLRVLSISWQAQYWAVWALANLTRVHSTKYCTLLEKDGGIEVLKSFIMSPRPDNFSLPSSVKCLGLVTLFQYYLYNRFKNLKVLEKSNEIVCFGLIKSKSVVIDFLNKFGFTHLAKEMGIEYDLNEVNCEDDDEDDDDDISKEGVVVEPIVFDEDHIIQINQDENEDEEMFL